MRVVVTGQVGVDKREFVEQAVALVERMGHRFSLFSVGDRMYAEAPDVRPGRILDLPLSRLNALRRSVFKDLLAQADRGNVIVNTHATFRWRHGLFYAFDYDLMKALNAELYVTLVDNIDAVHARLLRDGHYEHTLKDLMVWREEEVMATELLAQIVRGHGHFYILARGRDEGGPEVLARLMCARHLKKAYLSFPMSHLEGRDEPVEQIASFRAEMKRHFICFDPGDLDEKHLCRAALQAAQDGLRHVHLNVLGRSVQFETAELIAITADIDGQIYARDFKLIDQSDMIISLIPQTSADEPRPVISSGVERELQHAHEAAKDVFVIWLPPADPSPFITETATRVFRSVPEAIRFFLANNYVPPPRGGLFS